MKYELFYLVGASKEAEIEQIRQSVSDIVLKSEGVFEEKETVERRKLSYKVKHETHGIYIARRFELEDNQKLAEISQKMNLNPQILRFIISRTDELPELRTKEERIAEQEKRSVQTEKSKTAEKPAVVEAKEPKKEKKKASEEDIDKKLEEILNI
jgi:ribosomal protein S6